MHPVHARLSHHDVVIHLLVCLRAPCVRMEKVDVYPSASQDVEMGGVDEINADVVFWRDLLGPVEDPPDGA